MAHPITKNTRCFEITLNCTPFAAERYLLFVEHFAELPARFAELDTAFAAVDANPIADYRPIEIAERDPKIEISEIAYWLTDNIVHLTP